MVKKSIRPKLEFRFYDIPKSEPILALTGPQWINEYDLPFEGYMHFHNYMEIGICYYGKGYLQLGEHREMYDCPKDGEIHAVCIIPSPIPHHTLSEPGTIAYWEWFYIDLEKYLREMTGEDVLLFDQMTRLFYNNALLLTKEEAPVITLIMTQIRREMTQKNAHFRSCTANWVRILLIELRRIYETRENTSKSRIRTNCIHPAIRYMELHYAEPVKMIDVANACGFSESHFRRVFLEIMNMKPVDYLNMIRIQHSAEFLQHTDKSIFDVSGLHEKTILMSRGTRPCVQTYRSAILAVCPCDKTYRAVFCPFWGVLEYMGVIANISTIT